MTTKLDELTGTLRDLLNEVESLKRVNEKLRNEQPVLLDRTMFLSVLEMQLIYEDKANFNESNRYTASSMMGMANRAWDRYQAYRRDKDAKQF